MDASTERVFDRLPILADLAHCRGGSENVRERWVVDMVLGKT
jgi:hypothetical protein